MSLRWVRGDVGGNVVLPCGLLHLGGRLIGSVVHVRRHSVTFVHACFAFVRGCICFKEYKKPEEELFRPFEEFFRDLKKVKRSTKSSTKQNLKYQIRCPWKT